MAAQEIVSDSLLRLVFDLGVDLDGNQIYKSKNFNNIFTTASAEGLYAVVQAILPLQQHTLSKIERSNTYFVMDNPTV